MIVIDATPMQTEHRYRGIGTMTASLLNALTAVPHPAPLGLLTQVPRAHDLPEVATLANRPGVRTVPLIRPRSPRYHLQWLWSMWAVPLALRSAGATIYHALDPEGLVLVPGVTTICTLCDLIALHDPGTHFPPRRIDQRIGYARWLQTLKRVDHIIAISEATKQDAVERLRIPAERISVAPLAADECRFYPRSQAEIAAARQRYELRSPYFLHVGASAHHKNTANILRAFELFCRQGHGEHALYIVGRWTPRALASLRASYGDLVSSGRLRVLGFVNEDDLPTLYSGADALVYPSLLEGFGLPVLEAMRCATSVLTSNSSSLPEVGGDAALYVDPYNADEIADGLKQLAGEPTLRATLVARGLRQAELFTWQRTAEQTLRIYEDLS